MSSQHHLSESMLIALENAFQNPARNLTKSRSKNIHRYASIKMGKRITVESMLECDACYHFDFSKDVIRFCSQPIRFPYYLDGKVHTYVPDFLVQFDTKEFVLYEVKSEFAVSAPDFNLEWNAKQQAANELGLELELVEEKDIRQTALLQNLKLMYRYGSRDCLTDTQQQVLNILTKSGTQPAQYLGNKAGLTGRVILPILCNLLARSILETNLDVPLSLKSEFTLTCNA